MTSRAAAEVLLRSATESGDEAQNQVQVTEKCFIPVGRNVAISAHLGEYIYIYIYRIKPL